MTRTEATKLAKQSTRYGYSDHGAGRDGREFGATCPTCAPRQEVRTVLSAANARSAHRVVAALHAAVIDHLLEDHA